MATDTVLNELILQEVTQAEYEQLEKDNLLDENRVYLTPDNSLKGSLFDFKWADHLLDDFSWLRADTFSWQSGDVYVAAYNHLVADFEGATAETTTIDGIEITYYLADDKHIICLPDQEDKLLELYNKTGVAWYYILDTANKQFKLPRSKHNKYANTLGVVGNGMTLGLTDGRTDFGTASTQFGTNEYPIVKTLNQGNVGDSYQYYADTGNGLMGVSTDPEKSGLIAQQEQDTGQYKYLYFYVGNFEKEAIEQTAGIAAEMFNSKADLDLSNITASAMSMLFTTMLPDYSAGISMPANATHTATENGWVYFYQFNNGDRWFYIDDNQFHLGAGNGSTQYSGSAILVPISKGQTFMGNGTIIFFPCKN